MTTSVQYLAPFEIWKCNIDHLRAAREYSKTIPHLSTSAKTATFALLIFPFIGAFEVIKNGLISIRNVFALTVNAAHSLLYDAEDSQPVVRKPQTEDPDEEKFDVDGNPAPPPPRRRLAPQGAGLYNLDDDGD